MGNECVDRKDGTYYCQCFSKGTHPLCAFSRFIFSFYFFDVRCKKTVCPLSQSKAGQWVKLILSLVLLSAVTLPPTCVLLGQTRLVCFVFLFIFIYFYLFFSIYYFFIIFYLFFFLGFSLFLIVCVCFLLCLCSVLLRCFAVLLLLLCLS